MIDKNIRVTGLYTDYDIAKAMEPTGFAPEYGFFIETPEGDYLAMTGGDRNSQNPDFELRTPPREPQGLGFQEAWKSAQPLSPEANRAILDKYAAPMRDGMGFVEMDMHAAMDMGEESYPIPSVDVPIDMSARVAYDRPDDDGHHRAGIVIAHDNDTYLLKYDHEYNPEPSTVVYVDEIPFEDPPVLPSLRPLRKSDLPAREIDASTFDDAYENAKDEAELLMEGDQSLDYGRERMIVNRALDQLRMEGHPLGALYGNESKPVPSELYADEVEDKPAPEWDMAGIAPTNEPQLSI